MARRGTSKRRSQDQERDVASWMGGKVSPSSGAAETDAGDVRCDTTLIECKTTGREDKEERFSLNEILKHLAGVYDEAVEEGRNPALAIRIYAKGHPLARPDGQLDLLITTVQVAGFDRDW